MARHVYTVVEPFRSVGPDGVKDYMVGDEVVLDKPARGGRHLQLVRVEDGVDASAPASADHDGARAALVEMEVELQVERATVADLRAQLSQAQVDLAAERLAAAELRTKLSEAETALAAELQVSAGLNDKLAKATAPAKGSKG